MKFNPRSVINVFNDIIFLNGVEGDVVYGSSQVSFHIQVEENYD